MSKTKTNFSRADADGVSSSRIPHVPTSPPSGTITGAAVVLSIRDYCRVMKPGQKFVPVAFTFEA